MLDTETLMTTTPEARRNGAVTAVEVVDLRKEFIRRKRRGRFRRERKRVAALDGVSFTMLKGETLAILGQNGSGKSTLVRLLSTLLLDDGGSVTIFGHDAKESRFVVPDPAPDTAAYGDGHRNRLAPQRCRIFQYQATGLNYSLILISADVTMADEPTPSTVRMAFQVPGNGKRKLPTQTPSCMLIGTGIGGMSRPRFPIFKLTRLAFSGLPLLSDRTRCRWLPPVVAGRMASAALPWSGRDIWATASRATGPVPWPVEGAGWVV